MTSVRVFVPGSIGNVGPGLDILGLAVRGLGDTVRAERIPGGRVEIREAGHPDLPKAAGRHSSAIAARAAIRLAGQTGQVGMAISLEKGLPLSGGQGGSAASAVAGAVAANVLMGSPLGADGLLLAALAAEAQVAGRHLDNIAPALLGGLVLIRSLDPLDVVCLPTPTRMHIVLAKPDYQLATKRGRALLPNTVDRATALHQAATVAAMVAAAYRNDLPLFGRSIDDRIAEPARAPSLPGFAAAKRAALRAGALGCSISGSGPTVFAITASRRTAAAVGVAIRRAYARAGYHAEVRLTTPDLAGARVLR